MGEPSTTKKTQPTAGSFQLYNINLQDPARELLTKLRERSNRLASSGARLAVEPTEHVSSASDLY